MSLGAIGYYHHQTLPTRLAVSQFRSLFPETNIVMINDNGVSELENIAKENNAIYLPYYSNITTKFVDIPAMVEWVQRIFTALNYIQEDWFILLEDDVTFLKKPRVDHLQAPMNGYNPSCYLPENITNYIKLHNPYISKDARRILYGCFGGTILNTSFFRFIATQDWKKELEIYANITKVANPDIEQTWNFSDCVLSFLGYRYGGIIHQNPELGEIPVGDLRKSFENHPTYAILHRYKELYI